MMSACPATGETICLIFAASGRHRVVECQRTIENGAGNLAAVGHLAEFGGIHGGFNLRIDRLDRRQDRYLRPVDAERVREIDRVLDNVAFGLQVRIDIDGRVSNKERSRVCGDIHDEDVADAPLSAQIVLAGDDRMHQDVGMQCALHQHFCGAGESHFDRLRRSQFGARHRNQFISGNVDAG